jgi:hypothetical protein
MALWFMRLRTFLRMVLALLSMVGPLLGLGVAYIMLRDWTQVPRGDVYSVEHDYLGDAAWWGLLSLGTLLAAGRVLFIREARLRWLWLPIAMSFIIVLVPNQSLQQHPAFPRIDGPNTAQRVSNPVRSQLSSLHSELKLAVERGETRLCVSGPTSIASPYFRAGVRLTYQHVCLTTDLPFDGLLASSAPGTLYVVTRPGDPTIRLRATVLERNVDTASKWLRPRFGTDPMELTISTQPEPTSSQLIQEEAAPLSSPSAPNPWLPALTPHTNH